MMNNNVLDELVTLFNPIFEDANCELYHIEYVKENGENYLKIYIDKPEAKIDFSDCEAVSRKVNELFDLNQMEKKIDVDYLEVSSPGIFRALHNDNHFTKVLNENIKVILNGQIDGAKKFEGILREVNKEDIVVEVKGNNIVIPKDKIKSANLEGDI
ncbi:MAG: ribosome maturation factor RimP [Sarcina sp.]